MVSRGAWRFARADSSFFSPLANSAPVTAGLRRSLAATSAGVSAGTGRKPASKAGLPRTP
ncbi:MAG: hypothetical protein A2V58_04205 [Candidatus Muproteobacteria bacterium RBG_19FT_COMBO_61_10]|uniref:Uncharacterized protein n=1 Tax=Candidatus Muproteobacteria bacterium RBG_19FT_COMBO_61_10 TaxID=1817761 RepID=A0A1F6UMG1_9PROT|nr:MAG: hypothetical protein A2V58_04205 [Candidatus Muproteobacteria bacterium RBG_19FT_COMBO_61_10]